MGLLYPCERSPEEGMLVTVFEISKISTEAKIVNLVTSFSRQKPLKSKNKKHKIFWKTEFYHPAKFKLEFLGCSFLRPIGLACLKIPFFPEDLLCGEVIAW